MGLCRRSRSVGYRFPTASNMIEKICGSDVALRARVEDHAKGTRPVLHSKVFSLIEDFISIKRHHGTQVERNLYRDLGVVDVVDRMIQKRPLAFLNSVDQFRLKSGESGAGGFDLIGTDQEFNPLLLKNLQSYDEMQLSALLSMSTPTFFINS